MFQDYWLETVCALRFYVGTHGMLLIFPVVTQVGLNAWSCSCSILSVYSVGFMSVGEGKCCESRYSSVSVPGLVIDPSSLSRVSSVYYIPKCVCCIIDFCQALGRARFPWDGS